MALPRLQATGDTIIQDSQFNNARMIRQTTINQFHVGSSKNRDPFEILEENVPLDALFDSDARFDPPRCHPDTRTAVLEHISRWAVDDDSPPVMWLRGAAGAGKSAIAQTLSERWDEDNLLAASFYLSRTVARRNEKRYIISSLAYQLSSTIPNTRTHIEEAIRKEPRIFERNLRTQMIKLVVNPLMASSQDARIIPKIIVIDGLDECCIDYPQQDHEQQQKEILESIQLALNQKGFPLRFLIASRPERQIRELFEHGTLQPITLRTVLDGSQNPAADIELFLRCRLEEIRLSHPDLGKSWPQEDVISKLVLKSSGHFIYASVAIRHLSSPRTDPEAGLKALLEARSDDNGGPFAELDALYKHILEAVAPSSLPMVLKIFGLMIFPDISCGISPWWLFSNSPRNDEPTPPSFLAKYLFISQRQLYLHLIDLHSILDIPVQENALTIPLSFLHASFSEFLTNQSRSGQFYIGQKETAQLVLSLSIRHLFVQTLSPIGGTQGEEAYNPNGFAYQVVWGLRSGEVEPSDHDIEGLAALVDVDEVGFLEYVRREKLDGYGTTRQNLSTIGYLYDNRAGKAESSPFPPLLDVLKKRCPREFVAFKPTVLRPDLYKEDEASIQPVDSEAATQDSDAADPVAPEDVSLATCLSSVKEEPKVAVNAQEQEKEDELAQNPKRQSRFRKRLLGFLLPSTSKATLV